MVEGRGNSQKMTQCAKRSGGEKDIHDGKGTSIVMKGKGGKASPSLRGLLRALCHVQGGEPARLLWNEGEKITHYKLHYVGDKREGNSAGRREPQGRRKFVTGKALLSTFHIDSSKRRGRCS